jgi:hypothetical protein
MKHLFALFIAIFLTTPAWGAVGYDTSSTATGNGLSSLTISGYTVTGSNTVILCSAAFSAGDTGVTSVTFSADALTSVGDASASNRSLTLWRRVGVSGTDDAEFVFDDAGPSNIVVGCSTFTGVDQVTPLGSASTSVDYSSSPVNITVPANGLGYDVAANYNQTPDPVGAQTAGGSQTKRFDAAFDDGGSGDNTALFSSTRSTSGTFTWASPGGQFEAQIGVPINEVATSTQRPIGPQVWQ